ncbi:hypothetical protein LTR85_011799 [Meristemomyces frigidus]|nr:hypothetical protein LTR85_011799 [Meristemomyces frigidus]
MSGHDEVAELIAVLDEWSREKGGVNTYSPDFKATLNDVARSSSPLTSTDVPPSLAIYPDTNLTTHLQQHDQSLASLQRLRARACALCLDNETATAANKQLIAEYLELDVSLQTPGYGKLPLDKKVKVLRTAQQQAREHLGETFVITAVRGVETNGAPSELVHHHVPVSISWAGVQEALQGMTKGWQAREAGFGDGYSSKFGKWLYLPSKDGIPEKVPRTLTAEADYKPMRKILEPPNMAAVIWHERLWEASQTARAQWSEIEQEEKDRSEDDWLKKNGWLPFHPDLDPDFKASDEWDIVGGVGVVEDSKAPSVEPLSDHEDRSAPPKRKATGDEEQRAAKRSKPQTRSHNRKDSQG